ncbi:MAG: sialidase family protein [Planctomycetia bacterium]|nr:sialidase family protein [Planctomycetia bacterium]
MKKAALPLTLLMTFILTCSAANGQQGYGDDVDTLAPPRIWWGDKIPEEYSDANRPWQGIPSIEVTSDHRVWVTWFTGGRDEGASNYTLLITSDDKGETWSQPIFAIDPESTVRAYDPSLWYDPLGRLWVFWAQGNISRHDANKKIIEGPDGDKIRDCRAGVWCMITDNPEAGTDAVWSEPRRISDGIMLNKPIVDSQNRWLFPIAVWRRNTRYPVDPEQHIGPNVFVSTDEGKTLSLLGHSKLEAKKSGWDEHHIVERHDGSFWILVRVLHGMGEAFSNDGGKTWTDVEPSPVIKQTASRFCIRRLQSGNLILVKNGPVGEDVGRNTIMAALSTDDGKTWSEPLVIDERNDVTYPNATQSPDGTIYVVYDHGRYSNKEILMARFTEDDLVKGEFVSKDAKTRMLVNKAGK